MAERSCRPAFSLPFHGLIVARKVDFSNEVPDQFDLLPAVAAGFIRRMDDDLLYKLIDDGGRQFPDAHILPYNGCEAGKIGLILFKGFYCFPPCLDLLHQFFLFRLIVGGEFQEPFMTDCPADVVLIDAFENTVKFGNALFRLGDFTLALLGVFFRFLKTLISRRFLKCHSIIKEQRRHIENPLQHKQFQRFFPDKVSGTSSRVALIVGADILCFAIIFFIVMLFNVWSVTNVKLIDLLTANRKNESIKAENRILPLCLFVLSLLCIGISVVLFNKNGILPSRENMSFQIAGAALVAGTFLLFNSLSTVFIQVVRAGKGFYLKGLNTFLVRQIGSKIRTNYLVVTIVCGLLTITICAVSIGASIALAMNELSQAATPYDLNVLSNVSIDGDNDIVEYLATRDVVMSDYAENMEQISIYEADMTYAELFEGQDIELWPIDEEVPDSKVSVIPVSDFIVLCLCRAKSQSR